MSEDAGTPQQPERIEELEDYQRKSLTEAKGVYDIRGHMDNDTLNEWIDALRGDNYTQGASNLVQEVDEYDNGSMEPGVYHCCLGVYLDINDGFEERHDNTDGEMLSAHYAFDQGLSCIMMEEDTGDSPCNNLQHWLAHMNDSDKSFNEIADFLDKNREIVTKGCKP